LHCAVGHDKALVLSAARQTNSIGIALVLRVCVRMGTAMRRLAEYKQHAKECRILAAQIARPEDKMALEELARAWDKVAALRECDLEEPDEK
jgi:hypothetical protein